jgi:hypothetical protein
MLGNRSAGANSLDALVARIRTQTAAARLMSHAIGDAKVESAALLLNRTLPPDMKPLSLTYVVYRNGDLVGQAAALITLLPLVALVALGAWVAARRELREA